MSNVKFIVGGVLGGIIAGAALTFALAKDTPAKAPDSNSAVVAELQKYKDQAQADERLGQYAINMMYKSDKTVKNLSPARMQILARSIVRVANDIFDTEEHKQAFIGVLQIESGFLRFSQSPTGPKGLAQLTKRTFHDALKTCGVKDLKDDDVWETDLNLYAGACYFKEQLEREHGLIVAAMVDYNQGPDSADAKAFRRTGDLKTLEPAKYISKYTFNRITTTDQKTDNVPSISDLPKPTKPSVSKKVDEEDDE